MDGSMSMWIYAIYTRIYVGIELMDGWTDDHVDICIPYLYMYTIFIYVGIELMDEWVLNLWMDGLMGG